MNPRSIGAWIDSPGRCSFRVWAPRAQTVGLVDCAAGTISPLTEEPDGYWSAESEGIGHGFAYRYRIDGKKDLPDPASHRQPDGVHGPSAVVDHNGFRWTDDAWRGISMDDAIIYELHTGAFTPEGTFDGIKEKLPHLERLGITAIEIMPVAQFPGTRNWGYDGVYPFCVQDSYGGVEGLKRLVDACHGEGIAVILDVVYNHLGPEGNYIWEYGPYFTTDKYRTPWGWAINFDDADSDEVRAYFLANARYWLNYFHIDGLRLDAVHSIFDLSARTFLEELAAEVRQLEERTGKKRLLIAESDLNDPRLVRRPAAGGYGLDAQWSDDLHHGIHAAITGERQGYYQDFNDPARIAAALTSGYAYGGDYSAYRKRRHGARPFGVPATAFVVCTQDHDQIGNRMLGERLVSLSGDDGARLAAAVILLSPMVPLLFMGEEWGATDPFLYFVDHGDAKLNDAVREGRKREFEAFHTGGAAPDPTAVDTFEKSRPDWSGLQSDRGPRFFAYYRFLVELRKTHPVLGRPSFEGVSCATDPEHPGIITLTRKNIAGSLLLVMNFSDETAPVALPAANAASILLSTDDARWGGPVSDSAAADSNRPLRAKTARLYEIALSPPTETSAS